MRDMIILSTLNARYSHASLGLRYLMANLGEFESHTQLIEYTIKSDVNKMRDELLAQSPRVIGFGVYIWNVNETLALMQAIRAAAPDVVLIVGGPEVSYEYDEQAICQLTDYVITGWGELTLPKLLAQIIHGPKPLMKVHIGEQAKLADLKLPYDFYTDKDLTTRNIYVEASRGCPFKCEFCLSSLDKTAWAFPLDAFLAEMDNLYQRGARTFKFVDRTFNLKPETGRRILDFYLEKTHAHPDDPVFVHFEVVPDHLPELLKTAITQFPAGTLQFEIGIQTLNTTVQKHISRKTNLTKARENVEWLRNESHAHLHVDLIAGLPSETMESFAQGFNELYTWGAHEIQLGILKRLRGTPITRHTEDFAMRYADAPPYEILENIGVSAEELANFKLFAKYWDHIANSGRFTQTLPMIVSNQPYERFYDLTQHLKAQWQRSHSIALEQLYIEVANWLTARNPEHTEHIRAAITADYIASGVQGKLPWMDKGLTVQTRTQKAKHGQSRQERHQSE
ncbi:MAG: hpnR [Burkholderiaceae bacterium]|nr:hpnR [Burkholderiaceae bacterium]